VSRAALQERQEALCQWLAHAAGAGSVCIVAMNKLSGGAIQENWALQVEIDGGAHAGTLNAVLRTDAGSQVSSSHGRADEFALFSAAFKAGVTVPEPLWLCTDTAVLGAPFFIMRRIAGVATGRRVVKDLTLAADRPALTRRLGVELARIQTVRPGDASLAFLGPVPDDAPAAALQRVREQIARQPLQRPALLWAMDWLEARRHTLPHQTRVLRHGDFRTGNYMVDEHGLTGVLDWEFSGWGDPLEDMGWLCAACWRFGSPLEVGGVGERNALYAGYCEAGGQALIDPAAVHWWEVLAHVNWGGIALQQYERHASGRERSLLLALTGYMLPEIEQQILLMTEGT
jgi:aminoglycoside phosphotransferase (APT) family kinase protein